MSLYNGIHYFQPTTCIDDIKIGDYVIDLNSGGYNRNYSILRISDINESYYCATTCAKILTNGSIVKHTKSDKYKFVVSAWRVIVPKEYYHMIDKVLIFS